MGDPVETKSGGRSGEPTDSGDSGADGSDGRADGGNGGTGDGEGGPSGNENGFDSATDEFVIGSGDAVPPTSGPDDVGSVTLVGTDHVSEESVAEITETIERERPDVVAVELDDTRYGQLTGETDDEEVDASDIVSGKTSYQFLGYWLLSDVRERIRDRFAVEPGADVEAAIEGAESQGARLALVDREINETVQRLWGHMPFTKKLKVGAGLTVEMGGAWKAGLALGLFWGLLIGATYRMLADPVILTTTTGGALGAAISTLDALILIVVLGLVFGVPVALGLQYATRNDDLSFSFDQLSDADLVTAMVQQWCGSATDDARALADEREAYIAHRLVDLREAGHDVVAVVGAGRRARIADYLDSPTDLPPEETLVGPVESGRIRSVAYRAIGYAITVGFVGVFVLLALGGTQDSFLLQLFGAWFLVNFVAAAGVGYLAGAHWTSASTGGTVAWLTSVNPFITPGLFIAYVEIRYTKVKLSDIPKMKELMQNRDKPVVGRLRQLHAEVGLFKLLYIMTLANLASFFASVFFVVTVLPYLASDIGGVDGVGERLLEGMREGARMISEVLPFLWL